MSAADEKFDREAARDPETVERSLVYIAQAGSPRARATAKRLLIEWCGYSASEVDAL
jgi:hypothetical protein